MSSIKPVLLSLMATIVIVIIVITGADVLTLSKEPFPVPAAPFRSITV